MSRVFNIVVKGEASEPEYVNLGYVGNVQETEDKINIKILFFFRRTNKHY